MKSITNCYGSRINLWSFILFITLLCILSFNISPTDATLPVSGVCSQCHTMHNSQNNALIVQAGAGSLWNGSGQLTGGSDTSSQKSLLVTDCIGCHSTNTTDSIVTVGSLSIPIVFNTGGYPPQPLAGGNFYYVSLGAARDGYGHNVYGISGQDGNIAAPAPGAPGALPPATTMAPSCTLECHGTLAGTGPYFFGGGKGGCEGCHLRSYAVKHHETASSFRFLRGHTSNMLRRVDGVPDPNWEQTPTLANSNKYQGGDDATTYSYNFGALNLTQSITDFCSGCHANFHEEMDSGSVWIRHPSDFLLPEGTTEYAAYNPTTTYSNMAPVAWLNPSSPQRSEAVVMCLSCHRAHGSQYPDILRWDYVNDCEIQDATPGDCGCFVCHTTKDD